MASAETVMVSVARLEICWIEQLTVKGRLREVYETSSYFGHDGQSVVVVKCAKGKSFKIQWKTSRMCIAFR